MYVLRCLVAERIPMNEGCLDPVRIILPEASILNPTPGRAVVGVTWKRPNAWWTACWGPWTGGGEPGDDEQCHFRGRDVRVL